MLLVTILISPGSSHHVLNLKSHKVMLYSQWNIVKFEQINYTCSNLKFYGTLQNKVVKAQQKADTSGGAFYNYGNRLISNRSE